ncbi:MAG: hypothetical protein QXQ64_06000 [Candidatus Bathyarchaeia archaeon]|nr:hypothetical protein [Candidatus Bathyarchaeota archaeon]
MSEEGVFGITAAEKFFGLILIIVGALTLYFTLTSAQALSIYAGLFGFLSFIILAVGFFLLITKAD